MPGPTQQSQDLGSLETSVISVVDPQQDEPVVQSGVPDAAALKSCLDHIRVSAEFVRSERMVRFLEVIVRHAVENRSSRHTERQIGCEVFDRPPNWDPSIDTIVRSEIRRLRSKLEQYYERQGKFDHIRIYIPKGGYAAGFEIRPQTVAKSASAIDVNKPPAKSGRSALWGALLALLVAVITLTCLLIVRRGRESDSKFEIRSVSTEIGTEYSPAISPDGKQIAYVWDDRKTGPDIYLRRWDESTPHRLNPAPALRLYPAWSRDGRSLAYLLVEGDEVFVVAQTLEYGQERRIAHMKRQVGRWSDDASPLLGPPGPCWTAEGSLIVGDYDPVRAIGSLVLLTMDGQRSILLSSEGVDHYLYPRLSPDGKTLAYARYTSHGVGEIFTFPIAGGTPRQRTSDSRTIQGLNWSPDGRRLVFSSNRRGGYQLWSISAMGGTATPLPTNSTSATDPAFTASGDILFVDSRENWNIWRRQVHGPDGSEERLIASSGRNYDPRYSPDGRQIAFASDRTGAMELWIADADGSSQRQMSHLAGNWLGGIAWSPDGRRIAFDARVGQRSAIYVIALQDGVPHLLESNTFEERMPVWSQDGKKLYFNSNRDGELAIWSRQITTGAPQKIVAQGMFEAATDGKKLFLSTRVGTLWQSDLVGGHLQQVSPELKAEPVMSWFLNDGLLYLTRDDREGHREILMRSSKGVLKTLGRVHGALVPNAPDIAVSPDNSLLLFAEQDIAESDLKLRYNGRPFDK